MWQSRSLYLACLCWLLIETTDSDNTVYVTQGSQSVISCPLSPVLNKTQWIGPPGNTFYNLPGTTILNVDALPTDFVSRLAVHPQTGALIINNTQRSDENWYRCKINGVIANAMLRVFVSPKPQFIANTLANNSLGRIVVWAMEDSSVSLVCESKGGDPQPSLKWIKGGVTGSEISANYSVQNNTDRTYDVTSTITVMAHRSEDRVTYVCQTNHTTWSSPQNASVELYLYLKPRDQVLSEQVSLSEGGNLTVKCTVTGCRPVATLTWTGLQGRHSQTNTWIPEDETYNVTSLYTPTVSRQDSGVILQCTVTHTALTSSLTASSTVVVLFPPTNVRITNNKEVTAGQDTLVLTCNTGTANPIAEIHWRNGTSSAPTGDLSKEFEQFGAYRGKIKHQNLTITPTRYMDGNTITCLTQNSQSFVLNVSDSVNLNVKYNPITVISNGSVLSVKEGDTNVVLVCNADSKPVSSFMWVKDNVTLKTTGPEPGNRDTYIISLVNRTHYGQYSCIASNDISPNGQGNISLDVLFAPTNVNITNNRNITAGQGILILTCTTGTANPIADISWRNGTSGVPTGELSTKMEHPAAYGGQIQTQNLTITPTRYMDGSTIICSVKSTGADVSDSVILNVMFSPVIEVSIIPKMTITEGDSSVTIRCSASSNPISYFTLKKDGLTKAISEGQGSLDNHHYYVIQRINRTHAGTYSCTANNGIEGPQYEVKSTLELVVQYSPQVIVESNNGSYSEKGLTIKCSAHGVPERYIFRLTHSSLYSGIKIRQLNFEYVSTGIIIYQFSSPTYMDTGIYTCTVSNGVPDHDQGSMDKSVNGTIWIRDIPRMTSIDRSFYAENGHSGRLVIEIFSSLLDPQVTWYKHSSNAFDKLQGSEKYNIILSSTLVNVDFYSFTIPQPGYIATLEIKNVTKDDFGSYQVHVQNFVGEMSPLILILKATEDDSLAKDSSPLRQF